MHPLTLLPQLLTFGFGSYFFAPTIIRITVATVFIYLVMTHFKTKKHLAEEVPWVSHETAIWAVGLFMLLELAISFGLLLGFWTQAAAILAGISCIKALMVRRRFPSFYPISPLAYTLLLVMCLVLLISGAGALAFDLPL